MPTPKISVRGHVEGLGVDADELVLGDDLGERDEHGGGADAGDHRRQLRGVEVSDPAADRPVGDDLEQDARSGPQAIVEIGSTIHSDSAVSLVTR